MTIYPKSTECHYGGYGAERAQRCLATKSKAEKHRVFIKVQDFNRELKDVLHALTTAQVDDVRDIVCPDPTVTLVCPEPAVIHKYARISCLRHRA